MQLPKIGELNRIVEIFSVETDPSGDADHGETVTPLLRAWAKVEPVGGLNYWGAIQADVAVTHRVWIRYCKAVSGSTPETLSHLIRVRCEGTDYVVKRVTDVNGEHRFSMLECEAQYV